MPVISDDYNAVQSADVQSVVKPDADYLWWLTVVLRGGQPLTLRFTSTSTRDDFYKTLVDAMGQ